MQIQLSTTDYQFGRTKLFLRDKPAALLETRLAQIQALRLARLKAEIERKRQEEEQRRLEEEQRQEEEKKRKDAEQATLASEALRAAQEAEARRLEAAKNAPPEEPAPPPPPKEPEPAPQMAEFQNHLAAKKVTDPDQAPEPIPADAPTREEIEDRLMENPSWLEERKLKKVSAWKRVGAARGGRPMQGTATPCRSWVLTRRRPQRARIVSGGCGNPITALGFVHQA